MASVLTGSLRDQPQTLSQSRTLPGALADQRAHAGQAAPDRVLLKSLERWAVPYIDQNTAAVVSLHRIGMFCSRLQKGRHTRLHCIRVCSSAGRQDIQGQGYLSPAFPAARPPHILGKQLSAGHQQAE